MAFYVAVTALIYLLILVIAYEAIIIVNSKDDFGEKIIIGAYKNAYSILIFGLLLVFSVSKLPQINLDLQTTSYLILINKYISVLVLSRSQ